jgi:transcriptional regulator of acetoin/glycerol metabolism
MRSLLAFPWPGNVRQLKGLILDLTARQSGRPIRIEDVEPYLGKLSDPNPRSGEKAEVEWALEMAAGVISDGALYFGCARPHFYRLMRKHGLGGQLG